MLRLPEDEAVEYLLTRHIFELKIESTDEMYDSTKGDGSCGFTAIWQASQRAAIPISDREDAPVDVNYADDDGRAERIR